MTRQLIGHAGAAAASPAPGRRKQFRGLGRSASRPQARPIRAPPCRCGAARRPWWRTDATRPAGTAGAPVDRIGLDRKARLAEHADRARQVIGRRSRAASARPASAARAAWRTRRSRRCCGICPRDDARRRNAEPFEQAQGELGLRSPAIDQRRAAAGEQDARVGIATGKLGHRRHALGRLVERHLAARGRDVRA